MVFDLSDFTKQIILSFGIVLDIEISLRASRPKFCLKYGICKIFSTSIFEMPENKGIFGHLRSFQSRPFQSWLQIRPTLCLT